MAVVWVPALLRDLTGGQEMVSVPGETVAQVIDALDSRFPGMRARLIEADRLKPNIAVAVDGQISPKRLRHRLAADSEVHFLPAIGGGKE